jgi:iron complex outermembrane recepter protein
MATYGSFEADTGFHMLSNGRGAAAFLLALTCMLPTAFAYAQAAPAPAANGSPAAAASPQAQAAPAVKGVEEIVVTAQKREQLSQDVPIALTALSAANLEFRGIQDMNDLAMQVPGLQYGTDTGADQQVYIRGIGINDASGSVEAPIATYIDGVYQTRTFRAPTLGIDLERIEVLKGPQGTLFGRNATGGAVNIVLQSPTDELTGAIKGGVGSYGQALTEGTVSGPLIKHILDVRFTGGFSRDGGWIINLNDGRPINDHQEGDGRLALSFHPTATLSMDYDLLASKEIGGGVNAIGTSIDVGSPARQKAAGLPLIIPPSTYVNGDNPWKGRFNWPSSGDLETTQNTGTIKWDFSEWASIKSISAFQEHTLGGGKWQTDGLAAPIQDFGGRNDDDKAFSEELNLSGSKEIPWWKTSQPFTWLIGGYYMHEDFQMAFDPIYAQFNLLKIGIIGREKLNDYSSFGDGTLPLPWNLSLFGGVRYTYDRKALNQTFSLQFGVPTQNPFKLGPFTKPQNIAGTTCYGIEEVTNSHGLTPRVGMAWAPLDTINFYVKYSEGYNSGGNYGTACNDGYKSEFLDAVEGGIKGRWFEGRLTVDAAGYWNTFKDYQQFIVIDATATTPGTTGLINAPKAEMWGGEFEVTAIPIDNLTVNTGISIMHSQYDQLVTADPGNPAGGNQNLAGRQMQRAPNHTEQVGIEYDFTVPWNRVLGEQAGRRLDLGALRLRGEWYHTDYIVFSPFPKNGFSGANDVQNPYSIFNFYATLPTNDGKWSLRFFAKNFLAQKYYQYKVGGADSVFGIGGQPQWFGADLTYRF